MKTFKIFIAALFLGMGSLSAQNTSFGVEAGYNSFIASVSFGGASASASASGFYIGLLADFKTSDKFHIQPSVQYVNTSQDGESGSLLVVPVLGKYYVSEQLSLNFGPQFDLVLDESEGINKLGLGLALGLSFDINENLFASTKYSFGLTNRLADDAEVYDDNGSSMEVSGVTSKFNYFQIGLGYKF